ncbi:stage V sporulation protein AD [Desertibacillus haloalkaliphilus]|uniref:stage V sporulation protein AD n=1 Tax=Desertibacillus haloalkaliphilus TaxID=1328930 RepID=UPI001C25964C|nr:stage V sporulation protein AD [Desertibacillus haloalkaliphilus]MBU8907871.1 stage V sporulation protein AD [Desertibacillus haloalkaliphilus]
MKRKGKQTWCFENNIYITSTGTAVGPLEGKGPLSDQFDKVFDSLYCGEVNWEKAEQRLMTEAINSCLQKVNKSKGEIDVLLAGDLLNQNVTSSYVAREMEIPFLGVFAACSTITESLALASVLVDGGYATDVLAATSSHNATAERQFRYPTEFGGQKPATATFTVTGAGAAYISKEKANIKISEATIGRVIDLGMKNPYDMGSAMAPAAFDTIIAHLNDTNREVTDYDLIVTGDLSRVGSSIIKGLLEEHGHDVQANYADCGLMVFGPGQPTFAGGSGCACPAVVTLGHLVNEMKNGTLRRLLVVATGALLNPTMIQQKESIPCIAHGIVLESTATS